MPIPNQAKKVFEGIIFDVYQWEQEMFDGSKQTFEMLKRKGSVQVLPIIEDKILIAEEEQPHLSKRFGLIGGVQNNNEEPLVAVKREMLEETGYSSEKWQLLKTRNQFNKQDWVISTFIARDCKKISEPHLDAGEKINPLLVTFDEFMDIILEENFRSKDLTLDILTLHYQDKLDEFKKMLFD
ncbi:MAG TPA: NUDIX hydrolase [Candidatus Magasanikbacteria bacterium]|nr:NUDIX hydrolase [Candidatus Magasanikbacteria bacterium]